MSVMPKKKFYGKPVTLLFCKAVNQTPDFYLSVYSYTYQSPVCMYLRPSSGTSLLVFIGLSVLLPDFHWFVTSVSCYLCESLFLVSDMMYESEVFMTLLKTPHPDLFHIIRWKP